MPEQDTMSRARRDAREGKSPSTQAGEFVREQIHHIREGRYGARSAKQVIAIGLSEARRAGVDIPSAGDNPSAQTRRKAEREIIGGRRGGKLSRRRSLATLRALRREGTDAASTRSLSLHAKAAARRRSPKARADAAKRAARTRRHIAASNFPSTRHRRHRESRLHQ